MLKTVSEKIGEEVLEGTRWRSAREEHTKEEVSFRSGGWSRESKISTSKVA